MTRPESVSRLGKAPNPPPDPTPDVERKRGPKPQPLEERFWSKVDQSGACWLWTGCTDRHGYPQFALKRDGRWTQVRGHRISYELSRGPIPAGLDLDHRFPACPKICVTPEHLRPATRKQNEENRAGAQRNNKTSGIRGVYPHWHRWQVKVKHHGRQYYGGLFVTLEEVEAAAIALRNRLFTHNELDRV